MINFGQVRFFLGVLHLATYILLLLVNELGLGKLIDQNFVLNMQNGTFYAENNVFRPTNRLK